MFTGKKLTVAILCLYILIGQVHYACARKSLYVISDTQISELFAYKIDGTNLTYQINYICELDPPDTSGAVGIAIDTDSEVSFDKISFFGIIKYNEVGVVK